LTRKARSKFITNRAEAVCFVYI